MPSHHANLSPSGFPGVRVADPREKSPVFIDSDLRSRQPIEMRGIGHHHFIDLSFGNPGKVLGNLFP